VSRESRVHDFSQDFIMATPRCSSQSGGPGGPIIGVHLDLKGMMFKPQYMPQLMADLAGQKVNAVLVEYEDIFPFDGIDISHDPSVRWSRATLSMFLALAKEYAIEVIPLQQCLGHFEYLLCWNRYRKFAENRAYPSTIRVDDPGAVGLVSEMLAQIVDAHPDSKFIHLGMDEAHALHDAAKRLKRDVLDLFLDHLRVLLPIVESAGKTPIVWTDMLEDHFRPEAFAEFKDRVIFSTWDYAPVPADKSPGARLVGGTRVSKTWLNEPENPEAPTIGAGTKFIEDHSAETLRVLKPYRVGPRHFLPLFHADMWTRLGCRALPVSALRVSSNLSVMPFYNRLRSNVLGWSKAVKRSGAMGQIGTSWARGTSWCPPNFCIDLHWPLIHDLAVSMGADAPDFFKGIDCKTVDRIIRTLGRCREDWRLEGQIADEMDKLASKLKGAAGHRYEWESIAIMARVLELQRRAAYNIEEVDFFHANARPVDSEWQRRLDEQRQTLRDIEAMRRRVVAHFGQRYHGKAFEEWVRHLFDLYVTRIEDCRKICRKKLAVARRTYAR